MPKQSSINLTIDGRPVRVPAETTIMTAAEKIGIRIPRLCHHPLLSVDGACRICVVEVDGMRKLAASCSFPVAEGMVVRTTTPEIRQIRRDICELLLDNHPEDCQTCERDGNCELQRLAYGLGVRERLFPGEKKHFEDDYSSPGVIRNPDKCILCHRCVRVCAEVQGVTALGVAHRGFRSNVVPAYEVPFADSVCTTCGQCINVCPTAAFLEHNRTEDVWRALADPTVHTVVHFAPSVRAAIGEGFGLPVGTNLEGQTVAALRLLGFDRVFDTQFGADMCTYEEASELLQRIEEQGQPGARPLPMLTSCSAAWQKFIEQFYPAQLAHLTSTKSPMSILSKLIRTFYAEKMGWDPESIFIVTAMCCTAKKWEAARPQLTTDDRPDTDVVITTRELVWMCKSMGINLPALQPEKPDDLLGESTGAAAIYGATGGVMESALRSAYALKFGVPPPAIEFESVRGMDRLREAVIDFGGQELRIAVAHGLGAAHHVMGEIAAGTARYQYVEIMGCPGGCIGGGGQPYAGANSVPLDREILRKRAEVLYSIDRARDFRLAHENPSVQRIYAEYVGEPLGEKAHELFHTHFSAKEPRGILPPALLAKPVQVAPPECADAACHARWEQLINAIAANRNEAHPESALIPVLHAAQEIFGYLPQHVLDFVAYRVGVPAATVYGVATFYHHFSLTARGEYRIAVCVGTACYINGGARILNALEEELGIAPGGTTPDQLFSLSEAHCIGACSLAPAILLNGEVYGNLTPEKAVALVTQLRLEHADGVVKE